MAATNSRVDVLGVPVTHPDKVLWPAEQITKLDLVRYYERIAPLILRYVRHRPLTLRPFPHGVDRPGFYLKNAPKGAPRWLQTFRDVAESTGEPVDFVVATDERTLVWIAQYNGVEVHAWLSRTDKPDYPDWAVVDLDPSDATPWEWVVRAAKAVGKQLEALALRGFPKLTGSTGIHVLVPLERVHRFDDVRAFFEELARELCDEHRGILTLAYGTAERGTRVLIDYAQNARGKTTVAPYSVRPRRGAPVAMPVAWDELDDPGLRSDRWTLTTAFDRLERVGDILEPALGLQQRLPMAPGTSASRPGGV
jgi:bifunctional non-homologous end joining protein LigD